MAAPPKHGMRCALLKSAAVVYKFGIEHALSEKFSLTILPRLFSGRAVVAASIAVTRRNAGGADQCLNLEQSNNTTNAKPKTSAC